MGNKKNEKKMSGIVEPSSPELWENSDFLDGDDAKDIFEIMKFFVIRTPYSKTSLKGVPLSKYGWKGNSLKILKGELQSELCDKDLFFIQNTADDMKIALAKANLIDNFPTNCMTEAVCYTKKDNRVQGLCYHIRNCFAHGRFLLNKNGSDSFFVFEDVSNYKKQKRVSARMILKKSTLLKWIEIIEGGEKAFSERKL